jgi:hypothetical protein
MFYLILTEREDRNHVPTFQAAYVTQYKNWQDLANTLMIGHVPIPAPSVMEWEVPPTGEQESLGIGGSIIKNLFIPAIQHEFRTKLGITTDNLDWTDNKTILKVWIFLYEV